MDANANSLARQLINAGYEAYFVGGAIRDHLSGRPYHDVDIATDAHPDQIIALFKNHSSTPRGIQHGTVIVPVKGQNYEITSYRTDVTTDGRFAEVKFVPSLQEDLARRDFTVNAMAMGLDGQVIDLFNGRRDLAQKTIRAVGVPTERFKEDHHRMFRAIRFVSTLGFKLDIGTSKAICENAHLIKNISAERLRDELMKTLGGENFLLALQWFRGTGLLDRVIPEMVQCYDFPQNKYHHYDVFTHCAMACAELPKEKPLLRLAAFLHDIGKPASCVGKGTPEASFHNHEEISADLAHKIMLRLRFSTEEITKVLVLIRGHMFSYSETMTNSAIRRLVTKVGLDNLNDLIEVKWADRQGKRFERTPFQPNTRLRQRVDQLIAEEASFKIKDLKINGNDLIAMGLKPGPEIGRVLNELFEEVTEERLANIREVLMQHAKALVDSGTTPSQTLVGEIK